MASLGAAAAFLLCALLLVQPSAAQKRSYVVYLGEHAHGSQLHDLAAVDLAALEEKAADSHSELLATVLGDKAKAQDAIFYSYTKHINGFAANLDAAEAAEIARLPEVVSVFPNRGHQLHTTRSWQFVGLAGPDGAPRGASWRKAKFGEGVIIGNLDTGVWPESDSFRDHGLGPVPKSWKGTCDKGKDENFHCNGKLIGARYFNKGYISGGGELDGSEYYTPRDSEGHGTHTLSTAGGAPSPGASVFGYGNGTASGGSPRARVAAYRVCYKPVNGSSCYDADILAAFDTAIHDGVHILSVSLGGDGEPYDFFEDGIAIGSFHAVRRNISVVLSAGNSGPKPGSISNLAPWMLTVGASTMDREFPSYVVFNGKRIGAEPFGDIAQWEETLPHDRLRRSRSCRKSARGGSDLLAWFSRPEEGEGEDRGVPARFERSCCQGLDGAAGRWHRHGARQRRHLWQRGDRRRARAPGHSHQVPGRPHPLLLPQVNQVSGGVRGEAGDERDDEAGAVHGGLLVARSQPGEPRDPQARHHGARRERDRGVDARSGSHGPHLRQAPRRILHAVWHVHVVPARVGHRGAHQGAAPGMEPGGDKVGDHDDGHRRGQQGGVHPQRVLRAGGALRPRRRARVAQPRHEPWPRLRPRPGAVPRLPLRAPVQRLRAGHVQRRALQVPREAAQARGPQLPVHHRRQRHRLGHDGEAHREERGMAGGVQGVGPDAGGSARGREPGGARVQEEWGGEDVRGQVRGEERQACTALLVRLPPMDQREAVRQEPHRCAHGGMISATTGVTQVSISSVEINYVRTRL